VFERLSILELCTNLVLVMKNSNRPQKSKMSSDISETFQELFGYVNRSLATTNQE
jgi:hypothetical protein